MPHMLHCRFFIRIRNIPICIWNMVVCVRACVKMEKVILHSQKIIDLMHFNSIEIANQLDSASIRIRSILSIYRKSSGCFIIAVVVVISEFYCSTSTFPIVPFIFFPSSKNCSHRVFFLSSSSCLSSFYTSPPHFVQSTSCFDQNVTYTPIKYCVIDRFHFVIY